LNLFIVRKKEEVNKKPKISRQSCFDSVSSYLAGNDPNFPGFPGYDGDKSEIWKKSMPLQHQQDHF
jgi:hypothetical protein